MYEATTKIASLEQELANQGEILFKGGGAKAYHNPRIHKTDEQCLPGHKLHGAQQNPGASARIL